MKREQHREALENMKIKLIAIIGMVLLLIASCSSNLDENAKSINFTYIITLSGSSLEKYQGIYSELLSKDLTSFERADANLVLGRIKKDNNNLIYALDYYHKASEADDLYEKALHYETIASIKGSRYYFARAAYIWKKLGNEKRFKINLDLARGKKPALEFETSELQTDKINLGKKPSKIILGRTFTEITKEDIVVSQTDRVTRDWLSAQIQEPSSNNLLITFSEGLYYPEEELRSDIGWHEGARLRELKDSIDFKHIKAIGTLVAKKDGKWYAENEKGIFMFEVPEDKIFYPTTRFLSENLAMVIDTHGMNMIVRQVLDNNATVAYADCDYPGKAKAALYLHKRGIKVVCTVDRFAYLLLGYDTGITGNAPFTIKDGIAVIGSRPLMIKLNEKIIIENVTNNAYSIQYYDTATKYFRQLEYVYDIKLNSEYVTLDTFGETNKVVEAAKKSNAKVIAARVFSLDDYLQLKEWLLEDKNNRLILFHSFSYPYGYKIFNEFPGQTTFGGTTPAFE